jgi:hypothetical protein
LAGALTLCAMAGQFASVAHLAVVRHAVCLEHGELVHEDARSRVAGTSARGGRDGRATDGRATDSRANDARASLQASEPSNAAHGHDHCGVAAHRRDSVVLRAPALGVALSGTIALVRSAEPRQRASGRAIFHVAPKCSPPA